MGGIAKRYWPAWGLLFVVGAVLPGALLPFAYGKWLALHLVAAVGGVLFVFQGLRLPRLGRREAEVLGLLLAALLVQLLLKNPVGFPLPFLDRASFFLLVLAAWQGFVRQSLHWEDLWWPLALALGLVSLWGLGQLYQVGFTGGMPFLLVGSAFGHANTTAQFLGLALLLWWGIARPQLPIARGVMFSVSALSLAYLVLLRGRSAIMALLLGAGVQALIRRRTAPSEAGRSAAYAAVALTAFLLVAGLQLAKGRGMEDVWRGRIFAEKSPNLTWRIDVWRQTTELIADHPWAGVGVDRFTWEFVPYHAVAAHHTLSESSVANTPHNEFLRYAAEDGLPLAFAYLLAWVYLFYRWWKVRGREELWVLPALAFLLVEACVQFPWQNAFPVYLCALFAGGMAARIWPEGEARRGWGLRIPLALFALFFLYCLVRGDGGRIFASRGSHEANRMACRLDPSDSYSCLRVAKGELDRKNLSVARELVTTVLDREPGNYMAIRLMSAVAQLQQSNLEACFQLWRYDSLFQDQSSLHEPLLRHCSAEWRKYFQERRPTKFYPH